MQRRCFLAVCLTGVCFAASAQDAATPPSDTRFIWPDLAPGETDRNTGEALPMRESDNPPITRVVKIRRPKVEIFRPAKPNGSAVLILPGGGFSRVVPDLEGSEAAVWLGELGVTCFVLTYRTNEVTPKEEPSWKRPLQDAQRAVRWIREHAEQWKLDPQRIGLLAYSAGGQVGSMLITTDSPAYQSLDAVDKQSFRPDFAMLVYPWRCYDPATDALLPEIRVSASTPPTFLVHTHDDNSSSLGAVLIYAGLKKNNVPAELHVYENGGHGYGSRPRPNSNIGTWKDRAIDWLARRL
jgi:acetyl esterase/lipase